MHVVTVPLAPPCPERAESVTWHAGHALGGRTPRAACTGLVLAFALVSVGRAQLPIAPFPSSSSGSQAIEGARAEAAAATAPVLHSLWFVMNASARTADLGLLADGSESPLGTLYDTNVAHFTPSVGGSAVKVHSTPELAVVVGDADDDGLFWESLGDDIDALALRRRGGTPSTPSLGDFLFSTEADVGFCLPQLGIDHEGALDGSVFQLARSPDGSEVLFSIVLPELLLIVATGQYVDLDADVDVDAFAQDESGALYLSFRHDELVNGVLLADDGVLCIPSEAIDYSDDGRITNVQPDSAVIVLDREAVDGLVEHAGLSLATGTGIHTLSDLQALDLDPLGGMFEPVQPIPGHPEGCPHLLFNGQRVGATILTTREGGRIATLDGHALGAHVVNGGPIGLHPELTQLATHDLNALCVGRASSSTLVIDVLHGEVDLGNDLEPPTFLLGNFTPGGLAWMHVGGFFLDAGESVPSLPSPPGSVQDDLYLAAPWLAVPVPIDATGRARIEIPAGLPPDDFWLIVQAWDTTSGELSPPAGVWVWK